MIPSSVVYFILGFISCLVLVIMWAVYTVKKEETKRKEIMESYMKMFAEIDKKSAKDNKEE